MTTNSATGIFICLLLVLVTSCKNKEKSHGENYTGFKERRVSLLSFGDSATATDTLGWLSIQLPARLDTFYAWQHFSDCKNCGQMKYRFADNHYEQYAENGFYWNVMPDSVYQFTIWNKPYRETPDNVNYPILDMGDSSIYFNRLPELVARLSDVDFIYRRAEQINNRLYFITAFSTRLGYITQKPTTYVIAMTRLKNRSIHFIAECGASNCADFVSLMHKSIRSAQLIEK